MCLQLAEGEGERGISVAATHNNDHYLALPLNASHLFMGLKHPIASHVHRSPSPSLHHQVPSGHRPIQTHRLIRMMSIVHLSVHQTWVFLPF